ncbi:hypothetical protein LCGC14_0413520, partial [marine sediment metagenome]
DGIISDFALPGIFGAVDSLNAAAPSIFKDGKTLSTINKIKRIKSFSDPNFFTTWIKDGGLPFASPIGDGTGVFELTTVSGITASNSVDFGQGKATLTVEDPYRLMVVTRDDIDRAITDAVNLFKQNSFFRVTQFQLEQSILDLTARLNQIRKQTGASEIRFQINEDTILYKKLTARIDRSGREIEFKFDSGILGSNLFAFDNSAVSLSHDATEGQEGLQGSEIDLFKQIVQNTYTLMGLKYTTRSEIKSFNKKTNQVRKNMRLHYANKPIIQPMDVVSIFVSTKTVHDPFMNQGLRINYSDDSLLNAIDDTIGNIESAWDDIKNTFSGGSNGASYLENERNAIAGPDFPLWLWGLMRNDFTRQAAGTCVFNGIVKSSSHSYDGGKYTLSVNADDNCHYFNKGQININPSLEVFNSAIYDPLTPFKLDFDESSGMIRGEVPALLDANARLLNNGSVKAKLGRYKGQPLDQKTFNRVDVEHVASNLNNANSDFGRQFRRKFTNPDGFVYRWKEGIGSLVLWGEPYSDLTHLGSMRSERSPIITRDPFAGQDTMNVLSLLITGQPYNFNTFMKGALELGQLNKDDLFNEVISASFFRGLVSDTTRQNSIWGNFIPFKKLVVNEKEYVALAGGQHDLITRNSRLNKLLRDRAEAFDLATQHNPGFKNTPMFHKFDLGGVVAAVADGADITAIQKLTMDIIQLDFEIIKETNEFEHSKQALAIQSADGTLSIFGDDVSFDPSLTLEGGEVNETKRRIERAEFRNKINNLTLRRLWKVKSNEDTNLFIVDDTYDKNYDIQQFERSLSGKMENWKSNYATAFNQIESVRQILGLEVFADSQGHIRARPPQYNRMPSSVFRTMLQEKAEKGIKVFPDFLESLFFNQIQGITDQLEIVEDQIRLRAAALGNNTDSDVQKLIGGGFRFLTRPDTGKFGGQDIRSLMEQNEPDITEETTSSALQSLAVEVNSRINATVNFDAVRRVEAASASATFTGTARQDVISKISERIRQRTRQNKVPSSVKDIMSNDRASQGNGRSQVDILRVFTQIGQFVSERQRLMKRLKPAISNLREGLAVNGKDVEAGMSLLLPNLNRKPDKIFPELLEGMIEDENTHDLGTGSGARYILSDDKIISFTVNETEPPYNFVQVDGRLGQGIVPLPSGLEVSNGGNAIATAWAVDYDMWRMYGFRAANPVTLPFFDDPNSQCAPYAVYLLNLARKQILTATCTVIGNEFIQAGEVYYIESYDLLFYANSVSHSFTYNGTYTTTLTLTFGRNPGEYIPTQLDIIGKGLYSNSHRSDLVRQVRHNRGDNSVHLTVLVRDTAQGTIFEDEFNNVRNLVQGRFAEQNRQNLSNMLLSASGLLTPTSFNEVLFIELRIYENTNPDVNLPKSDDIEEVAKSVKAWLENPVKIDLENPKEEMLPDTASETRIDANRVKVEPVNLNSDNSETGEIRSPSSQAWAMARHLNATTAFPDFDTVTANAEAAAEDGEEAKAGAFEQSADALLARREVEMLTQIIVDVWITFKTPEVIASETDKK